MKAPVDRVFREVLERVVHPAHIPLEAKAKSAVTRRPGNTWPRRGLFGDHQDVGKRSVHLVIQLLQERDRFKIFPATELVGNPIVTAAVVAIQHRRDSIDANSIDVKGLKPKASARQQKTTDFVSSVVEDRTLPVRMETFTRIGVLVQRSAVEIVQRKLVGGEVRRHPIEDDADVGVVERIDEFHQLLGRAVPRRRREVSGRLVTPTGIERVFGDREKLYVRKAHRRDVPDQRIDVLGVGQRPMLGRQGSSPRPEMHLVDRDWLVPAVSLSPTREPCIIGPVVGQIGEYRRCCWSDLGGERHRVSLLHHSAGVGLDPKLVLRALRSVRNETCPNPTGFDPFELMARVSPVVKVADYRCTFRIWCPDREAGAALAISRSEPASKPMP